MPDAAETVTITINGVDHEVEAGQRLITAAEKVGEVIPRFCHHDKLEPVGKCRMCLVEVEGPRGKALVPSCTMPVNDGMVVDTESDVVKKAQEGILEFLLINHPLDCPICDKGGECPLQDQTMSWGPGESRFIEAKRTFEKPIHVSDIVLLDRERCVLCDRCVRAADEVAGDPLIEFIDRGNHVQINTFPNEPFSSYFSGNTVQLCPVGALTSVDYRFKARPWDLEHTRSVSLVDTVQSTVDVHTSRGKVIRVYGIENDDVNEGWLSDKDRFVFSSLYAEDRVTTPLLRRDGELSEASWSEALDLVAEKLGSLKGDEVGAIGGANNTNEEAFSLGKFMRAAIGSGNIDAQLGTGLDSHFAAAVTPRATINDLDGASTILLWGPDLKETLPVLYLRVRKAVRNGAKLVVASPYRTGLDAIATHVIRYRAGSGPDALRKLSAGDGDNADILELMGSVPLVALVGRASNTEDPRFAEAVAGFARGFEGATIMTLLRTGNVFGALDMGLSPILLPGRVSTADTVSAVSIEDAWGLVPTSGGRSTVEMLDAAVEGSVKALIVVGADPVTDGAEPEAARAGLEAAEFVVAIDSFLTETSSLADVVLPAAVWGEVDGTVTNLEGRVQLIHAAIRPVGQARPLNAILDDVASRMGVDLRTAKVSDVAAEIAFVAPAYAGLTHEYPTFEAPENGVVVPSEQGEQPLGFIPVETSVPVVSDRMTLHLAPALYDAGTRVSWATVLAPLVRDAAVRIHPRDASVLAVGDGDVLVLGGDFELPVVIDDDVPVGSVVLPESHPDVPFRAAVPSIKVDRPRGGA